MTTDNNSTTLNLNLIDLLQVTNELVYDRCGFFIGVSPTLIIMHPADI